MTWIETPQTLIDDAMRTIDRCAKAYMDGLDKPARTREIHAAWFEFFRRSEEDTPLRNAVYALLGGACGAITGQDSYEQVELVVIGSDGNRVNPDATTDPTKQGVTAALRMLAAYAADDADTMWATFNTVADAFIADDGPEGVVRHMAMVHFLLDGAGAALAAHAGGAR